MFSSSACSLPVVTRQRAGDILRALVCISAASARPFADYNWNPDMGAPSFVTEPVGDGFKREPHAVEDIKTYVRNLALWLAPLA
ncbi:MAG TPA: hypothetical protein V6C78_01150 [Crinalium sp.]